MPTSGIHLWLILWKAHEAVCAHAQRDIERLGIGYSDFAVLEMLLHKGPSAVNAIGAKVGLTSGSMTSAADRLERKGLVERRGHPEDRRARILHLTEAGHELISCAFAVHEQAMERATSGLTAEEREQVAALLKKLGRRAEELLAD